MPDFQGTETIRVQPLDVTVPYRFTFTVCTAATSNDGALPFGTTIASAVVTAHKHGVTDTSDSQLVASSSLNGLVVTVNLTYPSTNGEGTYHLRFKITLNTGAIIEFDFNRVRVKDR